MMSSQSVKKITRTIGNRFSEPFAGSVGANIYLFLTEKMVASLAEGKKVHYRKSTYLHFNAGQSFSIHLFLVFPIFHLH